MRLTHTLCGILCATLLGCGGATLAPGGTVLVVLPKVPDTVPSWVMDQSGACPQVDDASAAAATVVVMKATGDLVDHPDVLLDMMGLQGLAKLALCIKASAKVQAEMLKSSGASGDRKAVTKGRTTVEGGQTNIKAGTASKNVKTSTLERAFTSIASANTELTLYGAHQAAIYEDGSARVWALWTIDPRGLARTFIGAGVTKDVADAMVDRLRADAHK